MKITNGIMKYLLNTLNQAGFVEGATGPTGYAIYRNIRILQDEVKDYDKVVDEALHKYGKQSENGGYYIEQTDEEAIKKFSDEVDPVAAIELDIDLYQINRDDFIMPYCATATPAQYALIEEFFVLPEEEEEKVDENKEEVSEDEVKSEE